jgi:hypothetical protein
MSSVAYPAQPAGPGWWATAWLMFLGWLTAAVVLGGLYLAGSFVGAVGRNSYTGPGLGVHAINDWPFASNGWWSLLADVAVFTVALGVTTIAIAWQLRGPFATVSEGRLFVVLFFTGGAPLVASEDGAPLYFVIAVCAVRAWVVKDELRFPRRLLLATALLLVLTIASYGLLHPVWVESVSATSSPPQSKRPTVLLMLHNAGRASLTIERVSTGGFSDARAGPPWTSRELPVRIAGGHTEPFTLTLQPGSCGSRLIGAVRYRVLGRTMDEPLRLTAPEVRSC